jgi:hypothetical protein
MKCLDDCHTYLLDVVGKGEPVITLLPPNVFQLHFYEMRKDGKKIDGVTNEEVLEVLIHRLKKLNEKMSCPENRLAIDHLESALMFLNARTADKVGRHVEGTHNP